MNKFLKYLVSLYIIFFSTNSYSENSPKIHLVLENGVVEIETYTEEAPQTVKRIVELAKMLSGKTITDSSLSNARDLLNT